MRVKIGEKWYSAYEQPICIELTNQDKQNINNMTGECYRYAVFPDQTLSNPIKARND